MPQDSQKSNKLFWTEVRNLLKKIKIQEESSETHLQTLKGEGQEAIGYGPAGYFLALNPSFPMASRLLPLASTIFFAP
ncbi:MAG: hypothetical protein DRH17_12440 [Deltaproteobacteria bacterium]|nr:MAG: hypothetical protein DRH17_12440 [Deltaproteobacteria bacterium]